jgi:hypothetical protein
MCNKIMTLSRETLVVYAECCMLGMVMLNITLMNVTYILLSIIGTTDFDVRFPLKTRQIGDKTLSIIIY